MEHDHSHGRVYRQLQERLDANVTGAPASPALDSILKLLFTPQEAEIARHLPTVPTRLDVLARRAGMRPEALDEHLTRLAARGLVIDLSHDDQRYYALPPVVIGFFEYLFMRVRDDVPLAEVAKLFDEYMRDDDRFARAVFAGSTQVGRALLREEAMAGQDFSEVLDWERAGDLIRDASTVSVSLCSCRHKAQHLGHACNRTLESCLTLNTGAEAIIRMNAGRRISSAEGLDILARAKSEGLAQVADNVKRGVTYICNCCGCCCGMMQAIKTFDLPHAIVTSNWLMQLDREKCSGCAKCVKACPVGAIELVVQKVDGKNRGWAVRDEEACLGCGVCSASCSKGAISFRAREQRVYTPESMYERVVAMAIERGKLSDLIFEQPEPLGPRALKSIVRGVEQSAPVKAALAIAPLRSAFLSGVAGVARRMVGPAD